MMKAKEVKELYERACNEYLRLFCEKHEFDYEDAQESWVGNEAGGVVMIGDYYVGMQTIKTDIDEDAPEEEFIKHYDYTLEASELGLDVPNFHSWLHGCPRMDEEALQRIRDARQVLYDTIRQEKENFATKQQLKVNLQDYETAINHLHCNLDRSDNLVSLNENRV